MKKITQIPGELYAYEQELKNETAFIVCLVIPALIILIAFLCAMYGINPLFDWMGI